MPSPHTCDPFAAGFNGDRYLAYATLRRAAPVHRVERLGAYAVTRYSDVARVLRHPELFSSDVAAPTNVSLTRADPPRHTRLRRRIGPGFASGRVATLEPRFGALADRLVTAIADRGAGDVIADLAGPLASLVMAEVLGVAPEHGPDLLR